jgi:hypothetical protein
MMTYEQVKKFCSSETPAMAFPFKLKTGEVFASDQRVMIILEACGGLSGLPDDMFSQHNPPSFKRALEAAHPEVISIEILDGLDISKLAEHVRFGQCLIDAKYMRLIASLPGCCLMLNAAPKSPQRFEFEGGYGAVMPMEE